MRLRLGFFFAAVLTVAPVAAWAEVLNLEWGDLIPPGVPEFNKRGVVWDDTVPSGIGYDPDFFPLNERLDGKVVRIPGYVVPLNFEEAATNEFFLVPYVGACIHVPPPPPNQIVYVRTEKRVEVEDLFMAVWVTGRLTTEGKASEIGQAGYGLTAEAVEPYEE